MLLEKVCFDNLTKSKLKSQWAVNQWNIPKENKDTQNGNSSPKVYELDLLSCWIYVTNPPTLPHSQLNDGVWFMQIKHPNITLGILPEGVTSWQPGQGWPCSSQPDRGGPTHICGWWSLAPIADSTFHSNTHWEVPNEADALTDTRKSLLLLYKSINIHKSCF